jgi:lactoylglutathione lyase
MAKNYIGAVGIAVTELGASTTFFTDIVGMVVQQEMEIANAKQVVLGFEGVRGASIVLMQYTDNRRVECEGDPIKIVFYVPDVKATLDAVRTANYIVDREAVAFPAMGNAIIGFARDPDGHLIELIQKPPRK